MSQTPTEANAPAPQKKKSDLVPRLVTAIVAIPVLLWLLFWSPTEAFAVLILLATMISAWEYMDIVTSDARNRVAQVATVIATGAVSALMYFSFGPTADAQTMVDPMVLMSSVMGATLAIFMIYLATFKDVRNITLHMGSSAMSLLYCGLMPATLALLHRDAGVDGGWWVFMAMATVWGSDTGAYFSGRAFGKHKLAPRVSPKKTIEGAVGGLIASIIAVLVIQQLVLTQLTLVQVFILAIPANILGQVGDLCESLLKRAHGVKDSGVIVYGHGGLLDRIDALIFAAPWFYVFQRYFVS